MQCRAGIGESRAGHARGAVNLGAIGLTLRARSETTTRRPCQRKAVGASRTHALLTVSVARKKPPALWQSNDRKARACSRRRPCQIEPLLYREPLPLAAGVGRQFPGHRITMQDEAIDHERKIDVGDGPLTKQVL